MRDLEQDEHLRAMRMVPMAGNTAIPIGSLAGAEAFLKPISAEEVAALSTNMRIHYVAAAALASWVRDTIGDTELAARLDGVVATGRAYGLLVPEMKALIADRIAECRSVLQEEV